MIALESVVSLNPFPGLRPFDVSEADRFFGRQQQIGEVVARLGEVPFVAVAGASGCGKSSLVRAGVLTALATDDDTIWRASVMTPGSAPISNLAYALAPLLSRAASDEARVGTLYGRLRLGGLGLVEAVRFAKLAPRTRVLVVVDQFEEVFRFKRMTDPEEAGAFVKLLLHAAEDPQSPVSVIITLRSDSLGSCADFPGLAEAASRGQYLVPKLSREQRKEAIVKPVEMRGFAIAPRLVQRVLNDVPDDFDDLPVMQHVLTRTWNRWAGACQGTRPIDLEDYEAVGAAERALSNHADEAMASLPGREATIEKVFRALTERLDGDAGVRRPLPFKQLCDVVGGDPTHIAEVVERYRRHDTGFLRPETTGLSANPIIDISHESLIRQWRRLREWSQAEARSRAILLRLVEAARRNSAREGSLWRGRDLNRGLEWKRAEAPTAGWVALNTGEDGDATLESVRQFLSASARAASRERLKWRLLLGVAAALVIAVIGLIVFAARDGARRQRQTLTRELTNRALIEVNPARSARFAMAAVDLEPGNLRADYAVRRALAALDTAHVVNIRKLARQARVLRYTRDQRQLLAAVGTEVTILDAGSLADVGSPIKRDAVVANAWLLGTTLVTLTDDGFGQVQTLGTTVVHRLACEGEGNTIYLLQVSADDRFVGAACFSGEARVWSLSDPGARPRTYGKPSGNMATALSFSAEEDLLAVGNINGEVSIWKIGGGQWLRPTSHPIAHASRPIRDVAFYPGSPTLLATAGDDNQAIVWELDLEKQSVAVNRDKTAKNWLLHHERPVESVRWAPRADDNTPVLTLSGKTARMWRNAQLDLREVRGHDDWIYDTDVSADGERFVTASGDGTARVWSTRSGAPLAVLRGHEGIVNKVVINSDGRRLITASMDGTLRTWVIDPPQIVLSGQHWMFDAQFDPSGRRIVVGEEGTAHIVTRDDATGAFNKVETLFVGSATDFLAYGTWSADSRYVLGLKAPNGLINRFRQWLWDVQAKKNVTPNWLEDYNRVVFSPRGDELLTVSTDGRISVLDAASVTAAKAPAPRVKEFGEGYTAAAISPDAKWIAAFKDTENTIALWPRDATTTAPRVLTGHIGSIKSVEFSKDSKWLVTSSSDRTARIWSVDGSVPPRVLQGGHSAALNSASFNPAADRVVTASADSTIRVWNAATQSEIAVLYWHGEAVNYAAFSRDGRMILSASDDGTVKLGRCGACELGRDELRARVQETATLPPDELAAINREIGDRR